MKVELVETLPPTSGAQYIALLQELMRRYCIHIPKQVFNIGSSRALISKLLGGSVCKGIKRSDSVLTQNAVRTTYSSARVTVIPVVSADGRA